MVTFLGSVCVLVASTWLGILYSKKETYRLQNIQQMQQALIMLEGEISYLSSPLPYALESISKKIKYPLSNLFAELSLQMKQQTQETANEIWLQVIEQQKSHMYFTKEDIQILLSFGKTLGYLDKQQQCNQIQYVLSQFKQNETQLIQRLQKNGKLYQSMGVIVGLMLILVLI